MKHNINNKIINKNKKIKENENMIAEDNFELTQDKIKEMEGKLEEDFPDREFDLAKCFFENDYKSQLMLNCQNLLRSRFEGLASIMNFNNVVNTFELADKIQYHIDCIKATINSHHDEADEYYFEHGIEFCDALIENAQRFRLGEETHD